MNPLVAVAQMKSCDNIEANLQSVAELAQMAKERGAGLVCFPENFAFLPNIASESRKIAEPLSGPLFTRYCALARKFAVEISFGGFPEKTPDGKIFNAHVIVDARGDILSVYRKIHLFVVELPDGSKFNEAANYDAGCEIITTASSCGQLGLSICYDLRFPQLYQTLSLKGANLLLVPAAFTAETGKAHWEVLLRARAIENQCYVVASAQYGQHYPGRSTHGHSMIVDPWGTVVAQCVESAPALILAQIDLNTLQRIRTQMPIISHRRPELYDVSSNQP